MITINNAVKEFWGLILNGIEKGGEGGKHSIIRSQKPILFLHEAVKSALISSGIDNEVLYPKLGESTPELNLAGYFKQKQQDIVIIPKDLDKTKEVLTEGLLVNIEDEFGRDFTEHSVSINVRSQISSLSKNFDTMYERTIIEAYNLHLRCPKMCLGEVYMIAIPEIDSGAVKNNELVFKNSEVAKKNNSKICERYINAFQAINERVEIKNEFYKYESVCLLIVDFSCNEPKIFDTTKELIEAGLLDANTNCRIEPLSWNNFTNRLLKVYDERFDVNTNQQN
jgi:hypothetical protein